MATTEEDLASDGTDGSETATAEVVEETALSRYDFGVPVDEQTMERAEAFTADYQERLLTWTQAYPHRLAEWQMRMEGAGILQAGEPTLAGGYQYWNAQLVGPIQFFGDPPYRPAKIIAAGELAFFLGVIWINPLNSPGGGIPGTVALGSRTYTAFFETVNLTNVTNGPDFVAPGVFPGPAPVVTVRPWFFIAPNPGPRPTIYETHFAVDIAQPGQPFAALATWHFDVDFEPGFLGLPPVGPQWRHDIPARYLVYSQ